MPLASKDGKLYVKTEIDEDGNEVKKLCTSCCDDDTAGACCFVGENGEYSCEITTESTCESRGGKWHDGQECKSDDNPDGIDCSDPDNQPDPGPDPDAPTGACCYPDGDIPAHCHDGETQVECESAGGTWHEGKVCNEDGECPPVDPPAPTGRCCVYTGYQVDFGCGQTSDEARENAEEIARGYPGSFIKEPVADPGNEDCAYICPVYVWDLNGGSIVCWDEDEDGNPVTQEFCDALITPDVYEALFTDNETCGEGGNGRPGTCESTPTRSNPLP